MPSANDSARLTAIQTTRKWGKILFIGEGGAVNFQPSRDIIHDQKTIYGSWVTSIWLMEDLVERIVRWGIHPEALVTHRFTLDQASEAYSLMASGKSGKVADDFIVIEHSHDRLVSVEIHSESKDIRRNFPDKPGCFRSFPFDSEHHPLTDPWSSAVIIWRWNSTKSTSVGSTIRIVPAHSRGTSVA